MKGLELIKQAMKCQQTERIPWVPFVGCQGAMLINKTAAEYLQSTENIVNGVNEAIKQYQPDGIPVGFDLQIEAEALGCELMWADENPPAVVTHPLAVDKKLEDLKIPSASDTRIPVFLNAAKKIKKQHPDIALYGLITGPFTLAMHLLGTDIFIKMFESDDYVHRLLSFCRDVCTTMADYYIDAGCDIIAVVDPMTSQIGPEQFKSFVTMPVSDVFEHIRNRNKLSSFFVCGHAQQNIEVMCECKPDNVSIDENIPLDYVRDVCLPKGISFGGNLQLTVVLLMGSEDDCQKNALECMETGGKKGFILAPGCDLPYSTPTENIKAVTKLVHDPYQQEIVKTLDVCKVQQDVLDMSEYGKIDKVIIDIITLDSESCAPCQYMVEAIRNVAPQFEGIVEWREHKIKYQESVRFMTSLMVKNIPTICIDGKITFVSRIPPKEEIIAAIQKRILEKLHYKIRTKKGTIFILGKNNEECNKLSPLVHQAIGELGSDVPVQCITDEKEILSFGVTQTPAIVVAKYKVKAEGAEPSIAVIKEWIKEI